MNWSLGQRVSVLKETGHYFIEAIENEFLLLADENGFKYRYHQSQVAASRTVQITHIENKENQNKTTPNKIKKSVPNELPAIDLHAENLDLPNQLNAHAILLAQISVFKQFCNLQHQKKQTKFLVIHGGGEGRLKKEIREIVDNRTGIQMHDAQWNNGQVGCSRIELILHQFEKF